jgi:hypothetical protein
MEWTNLKLKLSVLLLAACFSFCEKPPSGSQKIYIKAANLNTTH